MLEGTVITMNIFGVHFIKVWVPYHSEIALNQTDLDSMNLRYVSPTVVHLSVVFHWLESSPQVSPWLCEGWDDSVLRCLVDAEECEHLSAHSEGWTCELRLGYPETKRENDWWLIPPYWLLGHWTSLCKCRGARSFTLAMKQDCVMISLKISSAEV